ncbi:kinase-like domain-containing protein [Leucosporidium creatinivorum]|uniref:Kinase-like domain-containing protein n=1 Tax=Leucosporidium creatinivorum TaxID=106004 RepID=A0A1Y2ENX2_9BASI|nr:kinase-like domain-containing protein [Leucosporidium creatinivorum]
MLALPQTLLEWRLYTESATPFWELLRPFFEEHGYILWHDEHGFARPRDYPDAIRAKDDYHEWADYIGPSEKTLFPARTKDRKDVMIRIISKGDQGQEHVKILKHLVEADVEKQHVLPLLELLEKDDMVFAVFPYVSVNDRTGWFGDLGEVFDFLRQVFEAFAFLHKHRIAHRDYGAGEVLVNFGGGRFALSSQMSDRSIKPWSWRKLFNVCYWITDFELSVQFDADSEPSSRLVRGIPTAAWGHTSQDYRKEVAPESLEEEPYCPFKADVFQVGFCAYEIFCRIHTAEPLRQLLWEMFHDDPSQRPSFAETLVRLEQARAELSAETLAEPVKESYCNPNASHISTEK